MERKEILTLLNECALNYSCSIKIDSKKAKMLLDFIESLQEMKEDLEFHIEDLESHIEDLESHIEDLEYYIEERDLEKTIKILQELLNESE